MLFGVKIYNKTMKLIKEISKEEIKKIFWKDKEKTLRPTSYMKYQQKIRKIKEAEFKNKTKGATDESTTKRNNTRRKSKKRVRRSRGAR
jgi:hypothetical protein